MFKKVDNDIEEGKAEECYRELKTMYDSNAEQKKNPELLWRIARACNDRASPLPNSNPQKKGLLTEGQKLAVAAAKLAEDNFQAVKYAAVLSGSLCELLSIKEKIQMGKDFKGFLDKALRLHPTEYSLLHMRGRFNYTVASFSWLEKRIASTFFGKLPDASFDDAIKDLLEVEKIKNGTWIENLVYLAKAYIAINNTIKAVKYLKDAAKIKPDDDSDREYLEEVDELLTKYDK